LSTPGISKGVLARRLGRSNGFGLPDELLAPVRGRLRVVFWISLFGAFLSFGIRVSRAVESPAAFARERIGLGYTAFVSVTAAIFLVVLRLRPASPVFALKLGLLFEVILGYVIAIGNTTQEVIKHGHIPYLTWTAPFMILFPLLVPSPPYVTLIAAIATGCSSLIAVFLVAQLKLLDVTAATYVEAAFSPIVATAFAYFGARVVYGLNVDYAKAKRIGNYELTSKLGSGGMGEVWLAHHRLLARPAAVKVISSQALGSEEAGAETLVSRFEREARATALLRSPHTIGVYDFGVAEDGSFFYVMELLFGMDLESLVLKFGPLPPERVIHLLSQACASLAEAHENDLVHRDVKPANIFVCQYGLSADFVKVLDFGLVKMDSRFTEFPADALVTAEDAITGTPAFLAPELVSRNHKVGPASDIYSLGCVAYWLLTGGYVFEGKSSVAMVLGDLTTSPLLDDLVLACLAKDPGARPASMLIVAERLAAIPLKEPWDQARANKWWLAHAPDIARRRTSIPAKAPPSAA
jgi:serine/threonine-protein kinase